MKVGATWLIIKLWKLLNFYYKSLFRLKEGCPRGFYQNDKWLNGCRSNMDAENGMSKATREASERE